MWTLNLQRLQEFCPNGLGHLAIETGTCRGNGTRMLSKYFSRVITIELSPELCRAARQRMAGPEFAHVEFLNGNSAEELESILPNLPISAPVFFFLDAHWSGDASVDWEKSSWKGYGLDTAHLSAECVPSGPEQCPLREELLAIMGNCPGPAHILIDDIKNLPEKGPGLKDQAFMGEDWSHLSREVVHELVKPRLSRLEYLENPAQLFISLHALTR